MYVGVYFDHYCKLVLFFTVSELNVNQLQDCRFKGDLDRLMKVSRGQHGSNEKLFLTSFL